jgi:hypothetical protein
MRFIPLLLLSFTLSIALSPEALANKPGTKLVCVKVGNSVKCSRKPVPPVRRCPKNTAQLCVLPKGDEQLAWKIDVRAQGVVWEAPVSEVSHYDVRISGHGVEIQQRVKTSALQIGNLIPGNAYKIEIIAYRNGEKVASTQQAINIVD